MHKFLIITFSLIFCLNTVQAADFVCDYVYTENSQMISSLIQIEKINNKDALVLREAHSGQLIFSFAVTERRRIPNTREIIKAEIEIEGLKIRSLLKLPLVLPGSGTISWDEGEVEEVYCRHAVQ